MKIALAGAGRIGSMHAHVLAALIDPSDILVTDTFRDRAETLAQQIGGRVADSPAAALRDGVDGLVVAASTQTHASLIRLGCDTGVPTFCEKPVTTDIPGTVDIQKHADASGVPVQIGFQRRFDPGYVEARRRVRDGELGELRRAHLVSADPTPPGIEFIATSGGIFRDLLVHDFDILPWVAGSRIATIWANGSARTPEFADAGDVDEAVVLLSLEDGVVATLQGSRFNGAGYDVRLEVAGTQATAVVGLAPEAPLSSVEPHVEWEATPPWVAFSKRFEAAYRQEVVGFLEVVAGSSPSPCTIADAVDAALAGG